MTRKAAIFVLALAYTFSFAQKGNVLLIKVEQNIIFADNNKITSTTSVYNQDGLIIEPLMKALKSKGKTTDSKCQIQIEPNQSYDVLFKIIATCGTSGYTDVNLITKIDGKNYNEPIMLSKIDDKPKIKKYSDEDYLNLTTAIGEDFIEIWARGGSLPKIFHNKEMQALWKESEEDPGKIEMSVYSPKDSAYIDKDGDFITNISLAKPGSTVSTVAENSARKLACGQSAPGVEDICVNGKSAVTLKPRSAYDQLSKWLVRIHSRFIDLHDIDEMVIVAEDEIKISTVIQTMYIARTSGFTKINLAKLAP